MHIDGRFSSLASMICANAQVNLYIYMLLLLSVFPCTYYIYGTIRIKLQLSLYFLASSGDANYRPTKKSQCRVHKTSRQQNHRSPNNVHACYLAEDVALSTSVRKCRFFNWRARTSRTIHVAHIQSSNHAISEDSLYKYVFF